MIIELGQAQRAALVKRVAQRARGEGATPTALAFLSLLRSTRPTPLRHGVIEPSVCLVVQGEKRLQVGADTFRYGAGSYVMSAIEYPTAGQIVAASAGKPYLAVRITLPAHELAAVIVEAKLASDRAPSGPPVFVAEADDRMIACTLRLLALLDEGSAAMSYLADAAKKELIFRLLASERGALIARSVRPASLGVGKAIEWLRRHFDQPIDIDQLAKASRMSVSGLRHEFKATTALAPLQFQKQLRLQEARRLLMAGEVDAGTAAFRVGYESASQFSREYRRLFGAPPLRDIRKRAAAPAEL